MKLLELIMKYTELGIKFTFEQEGYDGFVYKETNLMMETYRSGKKYGINLKLNEGILKLEERMLIAFFESEISNLQKM